MRESRPILRNPDRLSPRSRGMYFATVVCEISMAIDFFTVPSATFHILFVFVVLSHNRRRVLHFNVALVHESVSTATLASARDPDPS